jgi:outer membrane protein assembly factor BamE (lipoprotein component of BamABCDE complex)
MPTALSILISLALAALLVGCQSTQTPIVVNVPEGIVLATEVQKAFVLTLKKLPLGATKKEVERKLGKPNQAEATTWFYYLSENRIQGGYYITARVTFQDHGLAYAKLDFGHETISRQQR